MRLLLAALLAGLLVGPVFAQEFEQELELHFIDVGQGDAVLIRSPSGQTVLYDGGRGSRDALRYLRSVGVTSLDLVIASHADADHIGGLEAVVRAYRPRFYMDNGLAATTQTYERLLVAVQEAGSQLLEPSGQRLTLGEVTLQVLPPAGIEAMGRNDNSVGLVIEYGRFRAALTGDAEAAAFDWWARNTPDLLQEVDVYKGSHHGSENGDTPLSMSRFRPEVVVISVGLGNPFGHPSESALRLYRAVGARVVRTDRQGTVLVRAEPDGAYTIATERPLEQSDAPEYGSRPVPSGGLLDRPVPGSVRIACVLYDPDGRDDGREVVTLEATVSVDLFGWRLEDARAQAVPIPPVRLAPGERLEVRNLGGAVWNNGGDTVVLLAPSGEQISTFTYEGGGQRACR